MDRNTLVDREPHGWFDPEPNDERIRLCAVDGRFIDVRTLKDIEDSEPARYLRHVAEEPVARVDPPRDAVMAPPKA